MPVTVTEPMFFLLLLRMGATGTTVESGRIRWHGKQGKKQVPIAVADVEPLFIWRRDPAIEWTTPRTQLVRDVPVPRDGEERAELAFATASMFDAISVHGEAELHPKTLATQRVDYYALTSFECVSTEAEDSRTEACNRLLWKRLRELSSTLIDLFPRYGSAGGQEYAHRVSDLAGLIAAAATYYAPAPMREDIEALAARLRNWSVRAAIPTDEALRVAAEIGAEAGRWK